MVDIGYAVTRRLGRWATIIRNTSTTADPETGERKLNLILENFRYVVQGPVSYRRIWRAKQTAEDVGDTQFTIWTKDVSFTFLSQEDYIVADGKKYVVVTSELEDTTIVVTARWVRGSIPVQIAELLANNDFNLNAGV